MNGITPQSSSNQMANERCIYHFTLIKQSEIIIDVLRKLLNKKTAQRRFLIFNIKIAYILLGWKNLTTPSPSLATINKLLPFGLSFGFTNNNPSGASPVANNWTNFGDAGVLTS